MTEHVNLNDPYIHEPKGVASANAKDAYIADGLGSGSWVNPSRNVVIERLLDSASTAASQLPSGLGVPLQLEFGAATGGPTDPVQMTAAGAVTVNQAGTYRFKISVQYGRTGASGTSLLFLRALVNGVQAGRSIAEKLASADVLINFSDEAWLDLPAGAVITYEIIRDSTGSNFGGLYQTSSADGWNSSPTAALRVERWI